ncbi:MAG: glycoside hydrolase family 3 C-terminal domain-containing protein [Oscillospiraceae bacterium]|nr:glycoside hydrolase family 3 C-terminal domain-containing protein [Oscillospiraceae bacterium]
MKKDYSYLSEAAERRSLIRRVSEEGFVLLKNEWDVLPYSKNDKIAVFGRTQVDTIKSGTGSASITAEQNLTLITALEASDIKIHTPLAEKYKKWAGENPIPNYGVWGSGMHSTPEMPIDKSDIDSALKSGANKAIIIIGRSAGENEDTLLTKGDFYLSDEEEELFKAVTSVFSDVTVILNTTGIIDFSFIDKYNIKSVLYVNMLANSAIPAVADVLSGKVNPSGKLTSTVAFDYFDYPSSQHFGQNRGGTLQDYFEDIYVGYRYFETFEGADKKVRFPFGFGLSYTTFKIDNFCFKDEGESIFVSANVTNTGKVAGKETVQLYFRAPDVCKGAKLYKPLMNLCAFEKTNLLAPSESRTVCFTVSKDKLASFDDTGITGHKDCWVLEAGEYSLYIGNSVKNAKENCVGGFTLETLKIVEQCHNIPTALPQRLLGNGETEKLETIPVDVLEGVRIGIEPQEIDALLFAYCDGNIDALKKGESAEYRLIFCASGGYNLKIFIDKALAGKSAESLIEIYSDKSRIDLSGISVSEDGAIELSNLIFPIGKATLTIKAVCDLVSIKGLNTQKIIHITKVLKDGVTTIEAERFYECAFMVLAKSFCDKQNSRGGYLSNMAVPGKFATYKLNAEAAGVYELRFRYSNSRKAVNLNSVMAVFVSNVGQSVEDIPLKATCNKGEFNFVLSDPIKITLPQGESYLKLVSAGWDFPDIDYFTIERSSSAASNAGSSLVVKEIDQSEFDAESFEIITEVECEKRGIQLSEVYNDASLMPAFLDQLSDYELALLISGNFSNRTATGTTGTTSPLFDRGVYPVQTADGPAGLRLRTEALSFPSGTLLASSWNTALAEEMGAAMAYEAKHHEVDCILGPGLNIHRDIRCGRNFEYYSEDPLLSGKFAAAVVIGMQGEGISSMAKHYAANNCEYERLKSNSRVSVRALREIYLKGFEIVIKEANPHAIMTSYNHLNNTKVCEKHELITLVPRDEWGYDGIFVTDWLNDSDHVKETAAGHDLKMSQGNPDAICKAISDGVLSRERVRESAERVLRFVMKSDYFREKIKE